MEKQSEFNHMNFKSLYSIRFYCLFFSFILSFLGFTQFSTALPTADQLVKRIQAQHQPEYERALFNMDTFKGETLKSNRSIRIWTHWNHAGYLGFRMKMLKPKKILNLGVLAIRNKKKAPFQYWIYLPSSKKTRELKGGQKKGRFLDTAFNYEDFVWNRYQSTDNKVVATSDPNQVMMVSQNDEGEKCESWVDLIHDRVLKIKCHDKRGKHVKTITFGNYLKIADRFWRPYKVVAEDHVKKIKTILKVEDLNLEPYKTTIFLKSKLSVPSS